MNCHYDGGSNLIESKLQTGHNPKALFSSKKLFELIPAFLFMLLPAGIFYFILFSNAVRIPILDDYDIILGTLNEMKHHHALFDKLLLIFTTEHNGYKLIFENAVVAAQFSMFGHARILQLVFLGNSFPVLIFVTVIAMSRVTWEASPEKWILLTPVAWLIFQLQYASALDFASSSLQHLAVISFSLLFIYLLTKGSRWVFSASCFVLILAVAASPNGFFAGAVGLLMLAQKRRWRRIGAIAATLGALIAVYCFRYTPLAVDSSSNPGNAGLIHVNLIYAISFLGASAARYLSIGPSLVLGIFLCAVFAFAVQRRYHRRNPAIFYSMLFIILNAVAVSGLRSDLGVAQSLASRYRTYSNLFLAFSYLFFIEDLLPTWKKKALKQIAFFGILIVSIAFASLSDIAGARFLLGKKEALIASYRSEWQGVNFDITKDVSMSGQQVANPALLRQIEAGVYRINMPVFQEAVRNGVFLPPQNP